MMKKICILILVSILFPNLNAGIIHAKKEDPIIDQYKKMGYLEIMDVVNEFQDENKVTVTLPNKFPFEITHKFAKIDKEKKLQVYYLNSEDKQAIKVFITLDKNYFKGPGADVTLKKKNKGVLKEAGEIIRIDFLKDNLAYSVSYNKNKSPNLTSQDLIDIINSIK